MRNKFLAIISIIALRPGTQNTSRNVPFGICDYISLFFILGLFSNEFKRGNMSEVISIYFGLLKNLN